MSIFSSVAKDVAERAAKDVAEQAAKDAAKQAAKDVAEKAAKDVAERAAKDVAEKAAKDVAEKAAKDVAEKAAKDVAEQAAKDVAEQAAKDVAEKAAKDVAKTSAADVAKKAAIVTGGLAAAGLAAYTFIDPVAEMNRKNSTTYTITKIEDNSSLIGTSAALISISPGEKISLNDTITIADSDSRPSVDGSYKPSKIISDSQFEIVIPSHILTNGTHGKMTLKTDYNTQLSQTTQAEGGVVGNVLGGVGSVVGNVVGGVGSGLLSGLGINYVWIIVIIILIVFSSSSIIAMKM
jgi:hypothetical protein